MTGSELASIRKALSLSVARWASALALEEQSVRRHEGRHNKPVPGPIAMLASIYAENPEWFG